MWRLVNPFEAAVATAAALVGAFGLLQAEPASAALAAVWPGSTVLIYFALLLIGGLATLLGIGATLRQRTKAGSLMWRGGLVAIASAWGIYGVALLILGTAPTAAGLLVVLTLACFVRIGQLSRVRT